MANQVAVSIIIPAYNEAEGLVTTLQYLRMAQYHFKEQYGLASEIIVVDNASTDETAEVARRQEVIVAHDPIRNIARARNTGARTARGDVLVFVDADTIAPEETIARIWRALEPPTCLGGVVEPLYQPTRRSMRLYLAAWRWYGRRMRMSQGPAQFFRQQSFEKIGGYDESLYMGEDVECIWRLRKLARQTGGYVESIRDIAVRASSRRFDQWPTWRVLLWTNPLFIALLWRSKKAWSGWYERPPR
ncbi:MAG TPA: glycosyltransferase [Ktedonobacteraceae bacterium]